MPVLKKIFWPILILALLYGGLLLGEILTTQELTRITNPQTEEIACLMWKPRLTKEDGLCYVNLLNPKGRKIDTAQLRTLDAAFNALQEYGQIEFQGQNLTLKSLRTGEVAQRFAVHDGHLSPPD